MSSIWRLQQLSLNQTTTASPPSVPPTTAPITVPNQSTTESADRYNDVAELLQETGSVDNSTTSSGVSGITETVLQQENEMMEKIREQRRQAQKLVYKGSVVQKVQVQEDQSVVSMLTDTSNNISKEESVQSYSSVTSGSTTSAKGQIKFTHTLLNEIITPTMSYQEAMDTAEAYFTHRVNRETSTKDRVLHTFLASKYPQQHKEQSLGIKINRTIVASTSATNQDKSATSIMDQEDLAELDKQIARTVPQSNEGKPERPSTEVKKEGQASSQNTGVES